MFWLRFILALLILGLASVEGVAGTVTNVPPMSDAAPAKHAPGATNGAPKHPKTVLLDDDALATNAPPPPYSGPFPRPLDTYGDEGSTDAFTVVANRGLADPFNLIATGIFLLAIVHTFLAPNILAWALDLQQTHEARLTLRYGGEEAVPRQMLQSIPAAILHFFGEVEVIFGLWTVPLAVVMFIEKGGGATRSYFDQHVSYVEPLFVVVVMAIAASRPVVDFAVRIMGGMAGSSPARWWLALLTVGPLLGSLITEPAAMTICALLLGREFYRLGPSANFKYATLGLLFVNISVGGALTHFASPPVLIVAHAWHWNSLFMLQHFGLRAVAGIVVANGVYFLIFREQFKELALVRAENPPEDPEDFEPVPLWVTLVHLAFLGWTVAVAHEPAMFTGGFLFFLGFATATAAYQEEINLRPPLLVGFFLAGLVIHGGLQGWWLEPLLSRLTEYPLLLGATVLTAFNDNAAITYLAAQVPNLSDALRTAVVSGALAGGGLTVIANAPNPAGQSLLQRYFPEGGINPGALFLAALFPTLVMVGLFALPR